MYYKKRSVVASERIDEASRIFATVNESLTGRVGFLPVDGVALEGGVECDPAHLHQLNFNPEINPMIEV